jgi:hypothetical protein
MVQFGADGLISIVFFKNCELTQIYFSYQYCEIYKISVITRYCCQVKTNCGCGIINDPISTEELIWYSCLSTDLDRPIGLQKIEDPRIFRLSTHEGGKVTKLGPQGIYLILIAVRS